MGFVHAQPSVIFTSSSSKVPVSQRDGYCKRLHFFSPYAAISQSVLYGWDTKDTAQKEKWHCKFEKYPFLFNTTVISYFKTFGVYFLRVIRLLNYLNQDVDISSKLTAIFPVWKNNNNTMNWLKSYMFREPEVTYQRLAG